MDGRGAPSRAAHHPASVTARDAKELAEQAGVDESYVARLVELGMSG